IIFTMDRNNPWFEPDATIATVAPLIATASGPLGHNLDYLLDLDRTLRHHHIHDPYICDLIDAVRAFSADI
ncbi:MAG: gamma-glutamylcyclotransferase, partial [Lautropia sp.]|nr:gamma-glutamylcyclotransferase [Lautropia sp.]